MATYYFDSENGSDTNNGLSMSAPFRSPSKATALAVTGGDQILSKAGSYFTQPFQFAFRNVTAVPVIVGKYGDGPDPIIDLNDRSNASAIGISIDTCGAFRIQNYNIKRCGFGIQQSVNTGITTVMLGFEVYDCEISECGGDLIRAGVGGASSLGGTYRIARINGHDCNNDGIAFFDGIGFEVDHCRLWNIAVGTGNDPVNATSGDAITSHSTASGFNFHHIRIWNAHEGFHCVNEGTASPNTIRNVHVSRTQGAPIRMEGVGSNIGTWRIYNNVLISNGAHSDAISVIHVGDSGSGNIFDLSVYNNLLYQFEVNKYCLLAISRNQATAAGALRFRNNIFLMSSVAKAVYYDNPHASAGGLSTKQATKNMYYRPGGGGGAFHWDGSNHGFTSWQLASGIDGDSTDQSDPGIVGDPTDEVTHAKLAASTSPAVGFGDNLSGLGLTGLSEDYVGRIRPSSGAWDIGPLNLDTDETSDQDEFVISHREGVRG